MITSWKKLALIVISLPLSNAAWADTHKLCKTCPPSTAQVKPEGTGKRFQFNNLPPAPPVEPTLQATKPVPEKKMGTIFGDGSSISNDFKVTERKSDGRSVTTSNGTFNFTISNDPRNPSKHARHQRIFESGTYSNGKPPGMPSDNYFDDFMKGGRR